MARREAKAAVLARQRAMTPDPKNYIDVLVTGGGGDWVIVSRRFHGHAAAAARAEVSRIMRARGNKHIVGVKLVHYFGLSGAPIGRVIARFVHEPAIVRGGRARWRNAMLDDYPGIRS